MTKNLPGRPTGTAVWGLVLIAGLLFGAAACRRASVRPVIGVKIYEASPPFDGLFRAWRDLGINTAFVSETLLTNADFRARARADGLTRHRHARGVDQRSRLHPARFRH